MSNIVARIRNNARIKMTSAIFSRIRSYLSVSVLMEIKENKLENVRRIAVTAVRSSITCISVLLARCNEVITNRQNPNRFADVFKMCGEVFFGMPKRLIRF